MIQPKTHFLIPGLAPHPGAQTKFLESHDIEEVLITGPRGSGKTIALLMSFLGFVESGLKSNWKGMIVKESRSTVIDIIQVTKQYIPKLFPAAVYDEITTTWTFKDGETLKLAFINDTETDIKTADLFHGKDFTFLGWDDLTAWGTDKYYMKIMDLLRKEDPCFPLMVRSGACPGNVGASWVNERFIKYTAGALVHEDKRTRTYYSGTLKENVHLMGAYPEYIEHLKAVTSNNGVLRDAWILGKWEE